MGPKPIRWIAFMAEHPKASTKWGQLILGIFATSHLALQKASKFQKSNCTEKFSDSTVMQYAIQGKRFIEAYCGNCIKLMAEGSGQSWSPSVENADYFRLVSPNCLGFMRNVFEEKFWLNAVRYIIKPIAETTEPYTIGIGQQSPSLPLQILKIKKNGGVNYLSVVESIKGENYLILKELTSSKFLRFREVLL